jgi:hypothetical protein
MKFLFLKHEKHYLSATEAQNILKYGFKSVTFQDALSKEISDIELIIKSKSEAGCRVMTCSYPDYKIDLAEKLKDHFKENGFVVDIYKNPEISGFVLLVIGW